MEALNAPATHDKFIRETAVAYARALDAGHWAEAREIACKFFRLREQDADAVIERRRA